MAKNPWEQNWSNPDDEDASVELKLSADVKPWEVDWSQSQHAVQSSAETKKPEFFADKYEGQGVVEGNINYAKDYGKGVSQAAKTFADTVDEHPVQFGTGAGMVEGATNVLTGAVSFAPAALDYYVASPLIKAAGLENVLSDSEPVNSYEDAKKKYTYQPRGDMGQATADVVGSVLKPIGDTFATIGRGYGKVAEVSGASPETQRDIESLAPDIVGLGLGLKPGVKGAGALKTAVSEAIDSKAAFEKNSGKLYQRELEKAGGDNIGIMAKRTATEAEQEAALGKWVSDKDINAAKNVDEKLSRVREIRDEAGQVIGSNENAVDQIAASKGFKNFGVSTKAIKDEIAADPDFVNTMNFTSAKDSVKAVYKDVLTDLDRAPSMSFDELSRLKRVVNDRIDWKNGDSATNTAAKKLWHVLDDAQETILGNADKLAGKADKPLIARLRAAKDDYAKASQVEEGLIKQRNQPRNTSLKTVHGVLHSFGTAETKTGKLGAVTGGALAYQVGGAWGAAGGAYVGGKVGDAVSNARLKSKVKNSRFYTPP